MDYRISNIEGSFDPMISAERSAEKPYGYRYAFQGQERDDEVNGVGNSYTAMHWQYDPRLGRRWNIDPLTGKYPWQSPFATFNNNPIRFSDPLGLEGVDEVEAVKESEKNPPTVYGGKEVVIEEYGGKAPEPVGDDLSQNPTNAEEPIESDINIPVINDWYKSRTSSGQTVSAAPYTISSNPDYSPSIDYKSLTERGVNSLGLSLSASGFYAAYQETQFVKNGMWMAKNGNWFPMTKQPNGYTGPRSTALNQAKYWKAAGTKVFFVGAGISTLQFISDPTVNQGVQSVSDIGMGALGVWGGLPGAAFSGAYYADQFFQLAFPGYMEFRKELSSIKIPENSPAYMGSDGIFVCFVAGTKVSLVDSGLVNIEDVRPGDKVYSFNESTKDVEVNTVTKSICSIASDLFVLSAGSQILNVTGRHPFYVYGKGWVTAQDLKIDDQLLTISGAKINIDAIRRVKGTETVYNIEVEGNHNYYVTPIKILVHNK